MLRNDLYRPWFNGEEEWGFEIIDGEFSGVVVQISKIKFIEESTSEENLFADFHIIHKPEHILKEDIDGDLFKSCFQLILTDIITEAVESFKEPQEVKEKLNEQ
jgi:hypothetical protein